jgi:hypothetical protein
MDVRYAFHMVMYAMDTERCAVCGTNADEALAFCHLYPEGRRIALCTRACAEQFIRGGNWAAGDIEHRGGLAELIEKRCWAIGR